MGIAKEKKKHFALGNRHAKTTIWSLSCRASFQRCLREHCFACPLSSADSSRTIIDDRLTGVKRWKPFVPFTSTAAKKRSLRASAMASTFLHETYANLIFVLIVSVRWLKIVWASRIWSCKGRLRPRKTAPSRHQQCRHKLPYHEWLRKKTHGIPKFCCWWQMFTMFFLVLYGVAQPSVKKYFNFFLVFGHSCKLN